MIEHVIEEVIQHTQNILEESVGQVIVSPGKKFPSGGGSKFKSLVDSFILQIARHFSESNIPEDLLPLVIAYAVSKTLKNSNIYDSAIANLSAQPLRELKHNLDIYYTKNDILKRLRNERSFINLGNLHLHFNPNHHGEFAYALLHILNGHKLYIDPDNQKMHEIMREIADTAGLTNCITNKEGSCLGSRAASPYGIDMQFVGRKHKFCAALDDRYTELLDTTTIDSRSPSPSTISADSSPCKPCIEEPITVAIWNRMSNRDSSRHLSLEVLKMILEIIYEQLRITSINLLVVGDPGGLENILNWTAEKNIVLHDYRNKHLIKEQGSMSGEIMQKNEQLYELRDIMRAFNPKLIVGPRSGLMALCSLVGCAGLQISMNDSSNTRIISRVNRLTQGASLESDDVRLLKVFARCPVDGIGPHINLTKIQPNSKHGFLASSTRLLKLTISAMLVNHDDFKPLALELLASHLAGTEGVLDTLEILLKAYDNSRDELSISAIELAQHRKFEDPDNHDDSCEEDDQDLDGKGSKKETQTSNGHAESSSMASSNSGMTGSSGHHHSRSFAYKEKIMESKVFFTTYFLEGDSQTCKEQFSSLSFENKYSIFIDAISELSALQFKKLCEKIIPKEEFERIIQDNNFIAFEYALDFLDNLRFLLEKCASLIPTILEKTDILRYALQLTPIDTAEETFSLLKPFASVESWTSLLLDNDSLIPRAMTQNIDANFTWLQCSSLSSEQKRQIYSADNYMIFRKASLLESGFELLEGMCDIFGDEEAINAVNSYGGDIVYQALLHDNILIFNKYYPQLTESSLLNLRERIQIESPEKMSIYSEYVGRLQSHRMYDTPPSTPRRTNQVSSPNSIIDLQTPPQAAKAKTPNTLVKSTSMRLFPSILNITPSDEGAASAKAAMDDIGINVRLAFNP